MMFLWHTRQNVLTHFQTFFSGWWNVIHVSLWSFSQNHPLNLVVLVKESYPKWPQKFRLRIFDRNKLPHIFFDVTENVRDLGKNLQPKTPDPSASWKTRQRAGAGSGKLIGRRSSGAFNVDAALFFFFWIFQVEGCFLKSSCLELSNSRTFFFWGGFPDPKLDAVSVVATHIFLEFLPWSLGIMFQFWLEHIFSIGWEKTTVPRGWYWIPLEVVARSLWKVHERPSQTKGR